MDLASGCPFWPLQNGILHAYPSLQQDVTCQVAIVGAGVTGALAAYSLANEGIDVVVLDRRDVGTGSTGASTGLLQYEIDTPLVELGRLIGDDDARRAYLASHRAIDDLETITREIGDSCGFSRRDSLCLASRKADIDDLRAESGARREIGIDVELLTTDEVRLRFGARAPGALLSKQAAEIDAYRLTHALLAGSVDARGTRVFTRTEVADVRSRRDRIELKSADGHTVRADHLLFAAGYEMQRYLKSRRVKLKSTYAAISEVVPSDGGPPPGHMTWETARPYFYARPGPDRRMIIGGGDDDFIDPRRRAKALPGKVRSLARKYAKTYPDAPPFRPAFSWAGVFGESDDGLPFIGACDDGGMKHAYYAVGYGGNGITFSVIAAGLIRDAFLKRENPNARLFCFDR